LVLATAVTLILTTAGETRSARSANAGKEARAAELGSSVRAWTGNVVFWLSRAIANPPPTSATAKLATIKFLFAIILLLLRFVNDKTLIPFKA
jgi:hypothetical protein